MIRYRPNGTSVSFMYTAMVKAIFIALVIMPFSGSTALGQDQPVLTITPEYRDVGSNDGATTFTITNTGTGTMNWTAVETSDWVTLANASGTNTGTFTATFQDNFTTDPRSCTITVTAPGATGSPRTVTVNQAGAAPVLSVSPSNRSAGYAAGSATFTVSNTGSGNMTWTAAETSDWVTLSSSTGTNTGYITANYQTNDSTEPRTCQITVTAPGLSSPQVVTIYQAGTMPELSVTPSNRSVTYAAGSATFTVYNLGNGSMEWTAAESSDWVTLSGGSGTNTGTITANYQENGSIEPRSCTITVTAPGADNSLQTVTIYQAGTIPELSVTPDTRNVDYDFGSTTFTVSNSGSGTCTWTATESSDWVTLSDSTGTNSGTITANYLANDALTPRTCTITITAPDATGSPRTVTIYQEGTTPELSVTPDTRTVSDAFGSTTFSVSNTGSGAMTWTATESGDWVTLSGGSGTNGGTITANYLANDALTPRTCTIIITAPDAVGSPQIVTIYQEGTAPELSVTPDTRNVNYTSGSTTFSVSNGGSGAMTWTATESSGWVTLSDSTGTNDGTITVNYQANDTTVSRTCIITVTAPDATGSPRTVVVNQAGTTPVLAVSPDTRTVSYTSGSTTFSVTNSGTGIMTWTAVGSNDWVTLSDSTGTNGGTITADYQTNHSTSARTCIITVTASDATGSAQHATITQAGTKAVLTVAPASRDVGYMSDITSFAVSNTGSGTMNWIASGSSDWVTLSDSTGTNSGTITASFAENKSTSPRTCIITITGADGESDATGSPKTITINQAGTRAALTVTPTAREFDYTSGATTFSVSNSGSGTMTWIASGSNDWVTLSDSTGTDSGTIAVNYHTNNSKSPRTCIITVTAADSTSDATGSPRELTVLQQGKIDDDENSSGNRWGGSNILAWKIRENFAGTGGPKHTAAVSMREVIESHDVLPLPEIIASPISPVFRIDPAGEYVRPVQVKIPVGPETKPENCAIYYYSESPSHAGWYRGENVQGWLEPGSVRMLHENGQTYLECAINHSGIVQLGAYNRVALGGMPGLDYGTDSSHGWISLAGIIALIGAGLVLIARRYHPAGHGRR